MTFVQKAIPENGYSDAPNLKSNSQKENTRKNFRTCTAGFLKPPCRRIIVARLSAGCDTGSQDDGRVRRIVEMEDN
jgi:hypothetical protein